MIDDTMFIFFVNSIILDIFQWYISFIFYFNIKGIVCGFFYFFFKLELNYVDLKNMIARTSS